MKGKLPVIELVDINNIVFNDENPRTINDSAFEQLKKSIEKFPNMLYIRPVVLDKANMAIGGNQRLRACIALGWNEVPVIRAHNLTARQRKEFILKDNVSAGEFDIQMLKTWDQDLITEIGFDLDFNDSLEPAVKVGGVNRRVQFTFSEKEYLRVMAAIEERMETEGVKTREKLLKHLLEMR